MAKSLLIQLCEAIIKRDDLYHEAYFIDAANVLRIPNEAKVIEYKKCCELVENLREQT